MQYNFKAKVKQQKDLLENIERLKSKSKPASELEAEAKEDLLRRQNNTGMPEDMKVKLRGTE